MYKWKRAHVLVNSCEQYGAGTQQQIECRQKPLHWGMPLKRIAKLLLVRFINR